jgi:hypothetical protein
VGQLLGFLGLSFVNPKHEGESARALAVDANEENNKSISPWTPDSLAGETLWKPARGNTGVLYKVTADIDREKDSHKHNKLTTGFVP